MKIIDIELKDPDLEQDRYNYKLECMPNHPIIFSYEIDNIINKFDGRKITKDEAMDALDLISLYIYQEEIHEIVVNIDERNRFLAPAKEMTLEEIEEELGHKVKIVNKKEMNKND